MEVPHIDLVRFQDFEGCHQVFSDVFGAVGPSPLRTAVVGFAQRWVSAGGVVFGVHYQTSRFPVKGAEVFFGGAVGVEAGGVDFFVAMFLEDIEDRATIGDCKDSGLFSAFFAKSHCPEDNLELGFMGSHDV